MTRQSSACHVHTLNLISLSGGNQRELARAKNQKKLADANKGKKQSATSLQAQREACVFTVCPSSCPLLTLRYF